MNLWKQTFNRCCRRPLAALLAAATLLTLASTASAQLFRRPKRVRAVPVQPSGPVTAKEAAEIGIEAYIYGYPLVTMAMTRRVMTNVEKVGATRAPMGELLRVRSYPDANYRDVTAPNADTLYTTAWIDVGKQPWVLSLPDAQGRYYLMPMLDGWTDVFQVPGKRTTGTGPQKYAITGPGWKGTLPEGLTEYKSPTAIVWLWTNILLGDAGRLRGGPQDAGWVPIVPLSAYGEPYTPPAGKVDPSIDMKTPVREQVNALDAAAYFNLLASLMRDNPPAAADVPILARMARLGVVPGKPFDPSKLDPAVAKALDDVPKKGFEKIMAHFKKAGTLENGWIFTTKTGIYETDYLQRALITAIGLGANRPQDAIYPTSEEDATGKPYDGSKRYVMHFDKGQTPPADGFWSLTMYDGNYFFVANPLNRYTLSSRFNFKYNADGSLDFSLQNENPGPEKEANWLPAPKGRFILMLRLYWPKESPPSILDGTWKIPPVKDVE